MSDRPTSIGVERLKFNTNLTVGRKLGLLGATGVAGMVVVALVGVSGVSAGKEKLASVIQVSEARGAVNRAKFNTAQLRVFQLAALASDDPTDINDARTEFDAQAGELRTNLAEASSFDIPADLLADITAAAALESAVVDGFRAVITAHENGTEDLAALRAEARTAYDDMTTAITTTVANAKTVTAATETSARDAAGKANSTLILIAGLVAVAMALFAWRITRTIVGPLRKSVAAINALAAGDFTQRLKVTSNDEIGEMASSLNTAVDTLGNALRQINDNSMSLATASEELSAVSTQIGANAAQTSSNVQGVSAAVEESAAAVREISINISNASSVAAEAVRISEETDANIKRLGVSSNEIGDVVAVINSIAGQTNLLALNATIEAARAGDAGKGFAVVANEVKELANETSKATQVIGSRISLIQTDVHAAIDSIARVTEIIGRINEYQQTIASAVEEQSATNSEVAATISQVSMSADDTARGVNSGQQATEELAHMASELRNLASSFRY